MIAPARLAAYEVLRAVDSGRRDLPAALARCADRLHDERDRALAGEIATGTFAGRRRSTSSWPRSTGAACREARSGSPRRSSG